MRRTEGCAKLFRTFYQRLRASKSISKQKWFFHFKNIEQQCIQLKVWNLKLIQRGCFRRVIACTKSNDVCIYYLERLDSYLFHFYIFWWLERNRIAILKALCDLISTTEQLRPAKLFIFEEDFCILQPLENCGQPFNGQRKGRIWQKHI